MIQNSSPGGLRPSTHLSVREVLHNIQSLRVSGEETFCFFETWRPELSSNPQSQLFKQAPLTTAPGSPLKSP